MLRSLASYTCTCYNSLSFVPFLSVLLFLCACYNLTRNCGSLMIFSDTRD